MKVGQILKNVDGVKVKVLALCGDIIALSNEDNHHRFDAWWTNKELQDAGYELPKEKWVPKVGEMYYYPDNFFLENSYGFSLWDDSESDNIYLNKGLVFKTKEESLEAAKKMLEAIK